MSKAEKLTPTERRQFLADYDNQSARLHSCEYGHFDCSTSRKGPCMDEVVSLAAEDDDDEIS
jgi:hypothetical protein